MNSEIVNHYERLKTKCQLGVKAYSNLSVVCDSLGKIEEGIWAQESLIVHSLYLTAVVSYARPFLNTYIGNKRQKYPLREIKKYHGYDHDVHNHFIESRKKMIAHEDFGYIEPKIGIMNVSLSEKNFHIPVTISVNNKVVGFPKLLQDIKRMNIHCKSVYAGIFSILNNDLDLLRTYCLENQELYELIEPVMSSEAQEITPGDNFAKFPDHWDEKLLEIVDPVFQCVPGGYEFQEYKIEKKYLGPEEFDFPDGDKISISPNIIENSKG